MVKLDGPEALVTKSARPAVRDCRDRRSSFPRWRGEVSSTSTHPRAEPACCVSERDFRPFAATVPFTYLRELCPVRFAGVRPAPVLRRVALQVVCHHPWQLSWIAK